MANSNSVELELDYSAATAGDVVRSGVFSAGGHAWRVRCYPRGTKQLRAKNNVDDYISLFLELISKSSSNVKAIFDAFLIRRDGRPSSSSGGKRCVQVYPHKGHRSWGWTKFINLNLEEESPESPSPSQPPPSSYMVDGKLRIICSVIVLGGGGGIVAVPPPDIGAHLGRLLDHGDGTDVSFVVDCGEAFPAHRAVLAARSPVFRAELLGPMAEAKMSRITIHDVEPVTFGSMLRFIYTDELEEKDSMTTDLLQNLVAVADRYDLSRLKLICAQKLWEKVSVENVATMLIYAEMHGCPELKTSCLDFFVQEENFKEAVLNEGYAQLVQHCPSVIDEIKGSLGAKTMQWSEN